MNGPEKAAMPTMLPCPVIQGLISDSLSFGTGDRISLPDDIANGNMIENAPYCIAPDNRDSREPQCHFSRFSQSDLDAEKREDHSLRAHGNEVAYGHIDAGFEKAVTSRLAGHKTITFPNSEFLSGKRRKTPDFRPGI